MAHDELMKEIGSKEGFDPMPPRHHMRLLSSENAEEQAMGWMYLHTIRYRNVVDESIPTRTAYACDLTGHPLTIKDLAARFNWNKKKAERIFRGIQAKGWAENKDGKLWLRASFSVAEPVATEEDGTADAAPTDPVKEYIARLAPYVQTQVAKLSRQNQDLIVKNLRIHEEWEKAVAADAMMALRDKTQPKRLLVFEAFGILLQVGPKAEKYREKRERVTCSLQLELFGGPIFDLPQAASNAQAHETLTIQQKEGAESSQSNRPSMTRTESSRLATGRKGHAPDGHSAAGQPNQADQAPVSRATQPTKTRPHGVSGAKTEAQPIPKVQQQTSAADSQGSDTTSGEEMRSAMGAADTHTPPTTEGRQAGNSSPERDRASRSAPPLPEWDAVGRAAAQYGVSVSDSWQLKMVQECQKRTRDVLPAEIAQLIHSVGRQAAKKDSPNGWLLTVVPERCKGNSFKALRERMRAAEQQAQEYDLTSSPFFEDKQKVAS